MNPLPFDSINMKLHILSPVHVGTGEEMDPFSYVIRDNQLWIIDLPKWIESYPDKGLIDRTFNQDNFAAARSFIASNFNNTDAVICKIPIDDQPLINTYKKAIGGQNPKNQVLISPTMHNPSSMETFIPGSTIKGAVRTAIANVFVKTAKVTSHDSKQKKYEKLIFGDIQNDPMRNLKIPDVTLHPHGTLIVEAKEYSQNPKKSLTPKGHVEAAVNLCRTKVPIIYQSRIMLSPFKLHGRYIDIQTIIDMTYQFYVDKYEEEYIKFFLAKDDKMVQSETVLMNQAVAGLKTNETLVRMGHFSHVECMTLDDVRLPKTRKSRDGHFLPYGTTRTLANGIYPFGWVKLEFPDLKSVERPHRNWKFPLTVPDRPLSEEKPLSNKISPVVEPEPKQGNIILEKSPEKNPLEKALEELSLIKTTDKSRLAQFVQKIETFPTDKEKAELAEAVKTKLGPKNFRSLKQRDVLQGIIDKVKTE